MTWRVRLADDSLEPSTKCPKHFIDVGDEFVDSKSLTQCQRECPLAIYSDPEYTVCSHPQSPFSCSAHLRDGLQALSVTQIVAGYLGFVILIVVLIPFIINSSETNSFPNIIPLYIYISCGMMALGFIWPSFFNGFDDITCETSFKPADTTYFPCAVQGNTTAFLDQKPMACRQRMFVRIFLQAYSFTGALPVW